LNRWWWKEEIIAWNDVQEEGTGLNRRRPKGEPNVRVNKYIDVAMIEILC